MVAPAARVALLLVAAGLTAACAGGGLSVEPLPEPPPTAATTSTAAPPDHSREELPSARGRTTTTAVVVGPGPANLHGTVIGPGGPVAGATVRVERFVGDTSVATDVSSPDGAWTLPGVMGGNYRIRAWRAPDLAQLEPARLFLGARDSTPVELKVEQFAGPHAAPALTPNPATVDQPVTLVVQISSRSVDESGIVRAVPQPGVRVELSVLPAWLIRSANVTLTDGTGRARWDLLCRAAGPQALSVVVNSATTLALTVPACVDAAPAAEDPANGAPPTTRPVTASSTARPLTTSGT